ncbi:MAG: CPBP family intramembrane metalloprotease [Tidjanibacter sp.]|nr:CPBP family intramembrane metalloprotease [Tidjanibacter sp.]
MTKKILLPIAIAALLWAVMFSPWTAPHVNFWLTMSVAGVVLTTLSLALSPDLLGVLKSTFSTKHIALGVALAALLWCVFWVGDKVACWMFPFAEGEIGSIYSMKDGTSPWLIGPLLLLVIGPAEEIFWRGFVQRQFSLKMNSTWAFVLTTAIYALVHIWAGNFMLVVAAAVVGGVWGLLYRLWPKGLWTLVVSHAVWDVVVFLVFPI